MVVSLKRGANIDPKSYEYNPYYGDPPKSCTPNFGKHPWFSSTPKLHHPQWIEAFKGFHPQGTILQSRLTGTAILGFVINGW